MSNIDSLNQQFAIPGHLSFIEGQGGLTLARIQNTLASSDIALQGAHVLSFQPTGEAPVIWLSTGAKFAPGKSIRGGIPICWPWFGAHDSDATLPAHGFVRTANWSVTSSTALPDGSTRISFEPVQKDTTRAQWPHPCKLRYIVTVGKSMTVELVTKNTGSTPFTVGEALHTYFAIGDIDAVRIIGLKGCEYLDKVDGFNRKTESGAVTIGSEVDRVYLDTTTDCVIEDRKLNRHIRITKTGSSSSVVWNPWSEKSAQMGDMDTEGYRQMVCVESANAAKNVVSVAPGETHALQVVYSVEKP